VWPQSFVHVNELRTDLRHDVDHGDAGKVRAKRRKAVSTFAIYGGTGTPDTIEPVKFPLVQSNVLGSIEGDLRTILLKGFRSKPAWLNVVMTDFRGWAAELSPEALPYLSQATLTDVRELIVAAQSKLEAQLAGYAQMVFLHSAEGEPYRQTLYSERELLREQGSSRAWKIGVR
jgi:hypothetical protein